MSMDQRQKKAYALASEDVGMREIAGPRHNPEIVSDFEKVGHSWVKDDETAWCSSFVGARLEDAGLPSTRALNARSYLEWGEPVTLDNAQPGDVVVFWRDKPSSWKGHVGFFVRRAGEFIEVLGGNQANAVNVARYPVSRLLGVRRMASAAPEPSQKASSRTAGAGWLASLLRALLRFLRGK